MYCLWCHEMITQTICWRSLFKPMKPESLCVTCEKKLVILAGDRCRLCSRMNAEEVCPDCQYWKENERGNPLLMYNHSVYMYNSQMQEMIAKWKYRGDYILVNSFKESFIHAFNERFGLFTEEVVLVPIPLSEERFTERGFNQAKVLADLLPLENEELLTRVHSEKQAKKTRYQRITTINPFITTKEIKKPVIIIDDIYTTGATLRHAARSLKENGCPEVYAYTLIRG